MIPSLCFCLPRGAKYYSLVTIKYYTRRPEHQFLPIQNTWEKNVTLILEPIRSSELFFPECEELVFFLIYVFIYFYVYFYMYFYIYMYLYRCNYSILLPATLDFHLSLKD